MYTNLYISTILLAYTAALPVWNYDTLQSCPNIPSEKDLSLDEVVGDWRLAYIFLGQVDQGLDEENTCAVVSFTPTNDTAMELSIFIDSLRGNHIDRSTIELPADIISPGEWRIHAPLTSDGYLHARVILAGNDHLLVTFCSSSEKRDMSNDVQDNEEEVINWSSIFANRRRKRSFAEIDAEETHLWTAVLVKHNDISALKFVEYATVLMKHGYDVAKGELVSFGKCPIARPITIYPKKNRNKLQ